ncbi:MAG: hypothetical protein HOQ09_11970 [Gemmatimonadaceae bacterium]|nr:hypothetical protein [Gemmatimonadaceae bacterium]
MRTPLVALLVACAACASTATTAGSTAVSANPEVLTDAHGNVLRTTDVAATTTVDAKPTDLLRALVASYDAVGVPADVVDPAQQLVSRTSMTMSRTFKGARLSALFDCGQGQFGPRADDGRVTLSIASRVVGSAAPVSLTTRVDASVMPNDGAASSRVRCGSRGILEERIRREAFRQLGIPEPTQ